MKSVRISYNMPQSRKQITDRYDKDSSMQSNNYYKFVFELQIYIKKKTESS